ncbi:putative virion structural protein [Salmonella phage pSal-SNUABM-04]|nr:putative virion structural protein [Salmonella phage pSal-SNUABM-04]
MAVVFDPHQKLPGNKITGEPGTVIGTKYRMLVPKNGPFYTGSLVVKSAGKVLKLASDYVITHPYMTSMQRTGRSTHGMIWIINPNYTQNFTLDYHAVGIGVGSTAQVNAERDRNKDVFPSECQWEMVIGDVYFPPVDIQFDWENWKGERELMTAIAAIGKKLAQVPTDSDGSDVLTILKKYHELVDKLYRTSPAIAHVTDKNNPHGDDSYGRMRAIETNGIADDATLVYGRTQAQLATYVNGLSAKATDFTDKMLRTGADRTITGTFTMLPGLSSVTSSKDAESNGVGTNLQVDDKAVRALARDNIRVSAGNQPITFTAGANSFVLYPDSRGLRWNNKILLDPTTVGQYLPGNSGGGDGIYYGANTATVSITGNGIETQPFILTFLPPSDADVNSLAMRLLTSEFGDSQTLAATPALIKKLAQTFTGKLEKARAYINGVSLASSVTIDKYTLNLGSVENISDDALPVSTAQATEFAKYAQVGHTHDAAAFGIGSATTAKAGLIRYGGLVNDATLALDGSYVLQQLKDVAKLETVQDNSDPNAVIDILRYGDSGNGAIQAAVTITGWMVSIKANNYFVGRDYTVPLTTFNVAELFPASHEDATFGIFVDIVDNAAVYVIKDSTNLAESETMTRIGDILTDEDSVISASVRNVTRLGDYRELADHAANVSAHTPRAITQAAFGYAYGKEGVSWAGGSGSVNTVGSDWREFAIDGLTALAAGYPIDGGFQVTTTYRAGWVNLTPISNVDGVGVNFTPDGPTVSGDGLLHLLAYKKGAAFRTLSLAVTTSGVNSPAGNRVNLALCGNWGASSPIPSFTLGIDESRYAIASSFDRLNPRLTYGLNRGPSIVITGTVKLLNYTIKYTLTLSTVASTMAIERVETGEKSTTDITSRLAAADIDVAMLLSTPEKPIYFGVGAALNKTVKIMVSYTDGQFNAQHRYATALDYLNNYSELGRVRVYEGVAGNSQAIDLKKSVIANSIAAAKWGEGLPSAINYVGMDLQLVGSNYKAIVFRD